MASFESHHNVGFASIAFSVGLVVLGLRPWLATAQQPQGFAVERFYPSAPGGGWFVMDEINMNGKLGGAVALTTGYSRKPLELTSPDGLQRLTIVSNEAFVDFGAALTYDRYRFYLNLPVPLLVTGKNGMLGPYQLTAPSVNIGTNPDTISDPRIGFDVRLLGKPASLLRLGVGAQLIFPSGDRAAYVTDRRYRGMFRFLTAGDAGPFSYAGQVGMHIRPNNHSIALGGPNGDELLVGVSAGRRLSARNGWAVIVGPEVYGETAVRSFSNARTGVEGLLTGRLEGTGDRSHLRIKMGFGHGLVQHFGAPEWRVLFSVELVGQRRPSS